MTLVISEVLTITVQDVCGDGVYIRWQNDYGAMEPGYYFNGNISDLVDQSGETYFEPYVEDLATSTENIKAVNIDYNETLRVYATFDKANKEAFKQLVRSKQIEMLIDDVWYVIGVKLESLKIEKMKPIGKVILQLLIPKVYIK